MWVCVCLWRGGEGVCRVDKFEKEGTCWGKTATHALASSHSNSGRRYGPLQEPTPILSLFIIIIIFFCNYFKRSRCCLNASCKVDYLRTREFGIYLFKTGFIIALQSWLMPVTLTGCSWIMSRRKQKRPQQLVNADPGGTRLMPQGEESFLCYYLLPWTNW